jgi:hypothetical protein
MEVYFVRLVRRTQISSRCSNPELRRLEMWDIDNTKGERISELETSQTQRRRAEEALTGSENRLSTLMKRIIDSDYDLMEELVAGSDSYSIDEIHAFLNHIIAAWSANELTPAAMYALLKFVYLYLDQPRIQISFKNRPPIPICYFSSYLPPSAFLLYSYLKSLSFDVALFALDETERYLGEFIERQRPPLVLFTISEFLYVNPLRQLVSCLHDRNLRIVIGGIPFVYDESLKRAFSGCIFPRDLTELTLLLENSFKGEPR